MRRGVQALVECALRAASRSGGLTWTMCAENALPAVAMQASAWTGGTLRVPTVVCAAAQLALRPPPHRALRGFCSSATASTTTGSDGSSNSSSGGGAEDDATPQEQLGSPSALHASMDKLVDTAASLVGEGRLQQAVEVLQRGIELLSNAYPGSAELGELHNQAALLLLFGGQHDDAARHASEALSLTQQRFGAAHPLTAHRLLRLASIRIAAGQIQDAAASLAAAADMLARNEADPALSEARFYLQLLTLPGADGPHAVARVTAPLVDALQHLVSVLGPQSMIVRLALAAHSNLVGAALDAGLAHGEAAFQQHIRLQEVQDPTSAELGLTLYQLATTYYAHDLLGDAGPALARAAALLRGHYPEDHDLLLLCKHRMGMLAAASRDARAATTLLGETRTAYAAQKPDHPLAAEAELGLALARLKGTGRTGSDAQGCATALADMRAALDTMASGLGADHLLVAAGSRLVAQAEAIAPPRAAP